MNELEFLDAVGKIDDELLNEADVDIEYVPVKNNSAAKRRLFTLCTAASGIAAIAVLALSKTFIPTELTGSPLFKEQGVSGFITSDDRPSTDNTYVSYQTTENICYTTSAVSSTRSDDTENTESQTNITTSSFNETETRLPEITTGNNDFDSLTPDHDFSGIPLSEWLDNDSVVWGESDLKSFISSRSIPIGTSLVSDELMSLMQNYPDDAVFAVLVDFSSCVDEDKMNDWIYNGETISELKQRISEATEYSDKNTTYVDSDGTEHTIYFLTPESEAEVKKIQLRINQIKSAYYSFRINGFKDTFHENGLEAYEASETGYFQYEACFYCFAGKDSLLSFICSNTEAFVFFPANHFK